jgi:hypothetical protein
MSKYGAFTGEEFAGMDLSADWICWLVFSLASIVMMVMLLSYLLLLCECCAIRDA